MDRPLQLRIPGPVPMPPAVARELSRPMINHRGPEAHALHKRVNEGMRKVFGTAEDVAILTTSGTGVMEAAVANTIEAGDRVLVLVGGRFGERWMYICEAFGAEVEVYSYDFRRGADPAQVAERVAADPDIRAVFATQNESSTGVLNDIAAIAQAVREGAGNREAPLLIVDAISSLGGAPFALDEWGVDVAVAGSQKCLMSPPGIGFVAASPRAWARMEQVRTPRFYLDLRSYRKGVKEGEWPYTVAIPQVRAVDVALGLIFEEGLEQVFARHRLMRDMVRAGVRAMGLEPWTDDRFASPTLTAVAVPDGVDAEKIRAAMRDQFGVEIGGGQGDLKGKMWRIGHMGYAYPLDVLAILGALEKALAGAGWSAAAGRAVAAAQEVWNGWN